MISSVSRAWIWVAAVTVPTLVSAATTDAIALRNGSGVDVTLRVLSEAELAAGAVPVEFPMRQGGELILRFDRNVDRYAMFIVPNDEPDTVVPYREVDLRRYKIALRGRPLVLKGELGDVVSPTTGLVQNVRLRMWWEEPGSRGRLRVYLDGAVLEPAYDQFGRQVFINRTSFARIRRCQVARPE